MGEELVQNSTDSPKGYAPTKKEQALLRVILDPLNRLKTVEELCKLVPCDKKIYYTAFSKPEFVALYREESHRLVEKAIAPVVNACVREAVRGSHHHAKIVLGMADMYSEKQKHEHSGPDGGPISLELEVNFVDPVEDES